MVEQSLRRWSRSLCAGSEPWSCSEGSAFWPSKAALTDCVGGGSPSAVWYRPGTGAAMGDGDRGVMVMRCRAARWDGALPRLAAGSKGLDDDHTPAAARTSVPLVVFVTSFGIVALAARRGWVGYAEKPAGQCDIAGPIGIGEEGRSVECGEIRRAAHGSGSGG